MWVNSAHLVALKYGIIHYAIIQKHDHWAIIESYNLIIASGNQARVRQQYYATSQCYKKIRQQYLCNKPRNIKQQYYATSQWCKNIRQHYLCNQPMV